MEKLAFGYLQLGVETFRGSGAWSATLSDIERDSNSAPRDSQSVEGVLEDGEQDNKAQEVLLTWLVGE